MPDGQVGHERRSGRGQIHSPPRRGEPDRTGKRGDSVMAKTDESGRQMGDNVAASRAAGPPQLRPGTTPGKDVFRIPVDMIDRDADQPRCQFKPESLDRLAATLQAWGQLEPVLVWWDESRGLYILIDGERRWKAAKLAGLASLTAIVEEAPTDPAQLLVTRLL